MIIIAIICDDVGEMIDTLNPSVTKVWSSGVEAELFTSNPFSSTTCHYYEDYLHLIVLLQHHLVPSLIILSFDHIIKGKPSNRIFGKNLDFVPTEGGVCQSQLFQTKTITIQKGDFVAIWQGFPSPNQKITKTWDFFMKTSPQAKRHELSLQVTF